MRLAFIVMVILNLVFFAWQYSHDNGDTLAVDHSRLHARDGKDSIILLHERNKAGGGAPTSAIDSGLTRVANRPADHGDAVLTTAVLTDKTRRVLTEADTRCYTIGPFASREAGQIVAVRLQPHSNAIRWRSAENVENLRYWVTYVADTADQAQQAYNDMQGQGMRDISVMTDVGNIVSLGLFRGESTANRRLEEARRMGYAPTIRKQFNSSTKFWLDVEEDPQNPFNDKFWSNTLGFTDNITQRSVACN